MKPRPALQRRVARRTAMAVLLFGLLGVWVGMQTWNDRRNRELTEVTASAGEAVEEAFRHGFDRLSAVAGLLSINPEPTPEQFLGFTDYLAPTHDPDSVSVAMVVPGEVLPRVRQRLGELYGQPVRIFDVNGGEVTPGDLHAVVIYNRPGTDDRSVLGFDAASEPTRRAAIERALVTRRPTVTEPLTLLTGARGVLLVVPVITPTWRGVVVGAADLSKVVADNVPRVVTDRYRVEILTEAAYPTVGTFRFPVADRTFAVRVERISEPEVWWALAAGAGLLALGLAAYRFTLLLADRRGLESRAMLAEALNREKERQLETAALYELVTTSVHDVIVLLQSDGTVSYVSPSVEELLGYRPDELVGRNALELCHADDRQAVAEVLADWSGAAGRLRVRLLRKDGTPIWTEVTSGGAQGNAACLDIRDVTEQVELENRLAAALEKEEAANRAKTRFLAKVTHDLKTPITAIMGMAELALEQPLEQDAKEFIETIHRASTSMLELVNQLLDVSRLESGQVTVNPEPVDVREMVSYLTNAMRPLAEAKGLKIDAQVAADVPAEVLTDGPRLEQILTNLLGNAVKFTHEGSVNLAVEVLDAESDRVTLEFSVTDTGIGIEPDQLDEVFREFGQTVEGARYGGVGLGLFIARELARLLGGDLWAESQPGRGSVFHVTIRAGLASNPTPASARRAIH